METIYSVCLVNLTANVKLKKTKGLCLIARAALVKEEVKVGLRRGNIPLTV